MTLEEAEFEYHGGKADDGSLEIPIGESLAAENDISRWKMLAFPSHQMKFYPRR